MRETNKILAIKSKVTFSVMVNGSTYGPSAVRFVAVEVKVAPLVAIHKLLQKGCKLTEWSR